MAHKFTPGPWKVVNGFNTGKKPEYFPHIDLGVKSYRGDKKHATITVNESHDQEADSIMANAHLIAAAPELLEALESLLTMHTKTMEAVDWGKSFFSAEIIRGLNEIPIQARAAIAKALGETS